MCCNENLYCIVLGSCLYLARGGTALVCLLQLIAYVILCFICFEQCDITRERGTLGDAGARPTTLG